jgi:CRP/FNR family transcriptional regulator, cyclic AMP receptor protein
MKAKRKRPFNVETFLATVEGGRTVSNYRKNQTVFSQGDPADSVFYIQDGKVKVTVVSERGKEAVVAIHGKGDFFGEGCLSGQPRRLATAASMTECVIMRLDKAAIVPSQLLAGACHLRYAQEASWRRMTGACPVASKSIGW